MEAEGKILAIVRGCQLNEFLHKMLPMEFTFAATRADDDAADALPRGTCNAGRL